MKKNKLIKMATSIATMGTLTAATVIGVSSCGNGSTGEKYITATIEGTFKVGVESSGQIIVTGHNGVNLNKVDLITWEVQGLQFTKGGVGSETVAFAISGTPTGTFDGDLDIEGPSVSCTVRLVIQPADPTPTSIVLSMVEGYESSFSITEDTPGIIKFYVKDNLGEAIVNPTVTHSSLDSEILQPVKDNADASGKT
jgi:hypothetical protein